MTPRLNPFTTTPPSGRVGQRWSQAEVVELLRAGGSVVLVGASGMGRSTTLEMAIREYAEAKDGLLVVRVFVGPFEGWVRWFEDTRKAVVREGRRLTADDAMWDGLVSFWEKAAPTGDVSLGDASAALRGVLDDCREAASAIVFVVDGLQAWLGGAAGENEPEARVAGRLLKQWLDDVSSAPIQILAIDRPEVEWERAGALAEVLGKLERVPVDPLTADEVDELLESAAPTLEEGDRKFVYRMVGGHPRLVAALGLALWRWQQRAGRLGEEARLSLTLSLDAMVGAVVEDGLASLRRAGRGQLADDVFAVCRGAEPESFSAGDLTALRPLGLVDAAGRIPDRIRAAVARGSALARAARAVEGPESETDARPTSTEEIGVESELGRKERLLFSYLRERPDERVDWRELAAAYFLNEPEVLADEEKAKHTLRAAVNRLNAKLAPSSAAARSGWKLVQYERGRGFYADREALESLGH